jgi:hypothetical protein
MVEKHKIMILMDFANNMLFFSHGVLTTKKWCWTTKHSEQKTCYILDCSLWSLDQFARRLANNMWKWALTYLCLVGNGGMGWLLILIAGHFPIPYEAPVSWLNVINIFFRPSPRKMRRLFQQSRDGTSRHLVLTHPKTNRNWHQAPM